MSEELKINIPLFNIGEKAELENKLSFHLDEFTNEIMKTMTRDKEIIILKKVIEKQQKEIEELKHNRDEYKEEYIKLLNARYYNYISKDKIREKIEGLKEIADEDNPDIYIKIDGYEELLEDGDHIPRID